ncbi:clathrin coat assembly protein AP180-like isoform X2 [Cyprinodon tularosa]|uniref:clathrin coat assembly protein AP180-like isoform X2 n=1 Tax=Cyprinodon tularosa TaxID=77115 RepID=UPI0018E28A87|nr:clathrin coat assembly protein AP180-like isoform X2 [Cyprinodon tularosa]
MSGQTLTDRIAAAQYTLTGSEVSRAVCKATTHEQTAPKKKHLEYLIQATQDSNVNIPQMADVLMERVGNASWVVVFKALITTHHLMVHGNERFLQFLGSRNTLFNLMNFLDKTGSHGYDMSTFIRRYSRYLNEKAFAYRQMSFDFGRVKKGADGAMRTMSVEKLLKGMPILQSNIDSLLDFEVQPKDLNNGVINSCFLLLFKDLIKLYACYNDGIINLLEKFFQMKRSQCKDGLEIYKRFLTRMTRVSEFFKIAEQVGIDKNDIPELTQAPESLLESLETHLNTLEGKKPSPTKDATANNSTPAAAAPPAKPAPPAAAGGPPARPGPPAKPPPPSVTPTAPAPAPTITSNALDDGFLLDLDPMSSSSAVGAAATSSMTGWGDLLAEAAPAATNGAPQALAADGKSANAAAAGAAAPAATAAPAAAKVAAPPAAKVAAPAAASATTAAAAAPVAPPTSLPISAPAPAAASAADIDLFGDAFAPSPGDGPAAVAAGPAADAFSGSDPFATTEGSAGIAPELDLFAMKPADTEASSAITPPTSSEAPTIIAPIASPAPSSTTTTTDTTTTESAAAPTLDFFGDMFDSMPEQSPTAESKAATTPSVDFFGADLPAFSRGPSPLPESAPAGDIVTDTFTSPAPTTSPTPSAAAATTPALQVSSPPKPEPEPVIDLLDSFSGPVEEKQSSAPAVPGEDLLGGLISPTLAPTAAPAVAPAPVQNNLLETGFDALASLPSLTPPLPAAASAVPIAPTAAATEPASTTPVPSGGFDASMFGGLGELLMPAVTPQSTGGSTAGSTAGSIGTPIAAGGISAIPPATPPPPKTIGGDLDSSLANLVGDLGMKKKDPLSEKKLTGGANWMPQVAPTSWGTPGAPMAAVAPVAPGAAPPGAPMVPTMSAQPGFGMPPAGGPGVPVMQPMMSQPMMGQPMMRPAFTGLPGAAPGAAAPGAPLSSGPANQSPKKPKDPLADLDLKDFL